MYACSRGKIRKTEEEEEEEEEEVDDGGAEVSLEENDARYNRSERRGGTNSGVRGTR